MPTPPRKPGSTKASPGSRSARATGGVRAAAPGTASLTIRRLGAADSIPEITRLLHRAYQAQMDMGLEPLAGRQDDSITRERAANSECWLALSRAHSAGPAAGPTAERIVGVILFEEQEKATFPAHFLRPHVAHFAQFAVDPSLQGLGIGRALLEKVEERAREKGATELALSMAEPDAALRAFYEKRGFRFIEYWQWPYTNYRSCILSKAL